MLIYIIICTKKIQLQGSFGTCNIFRGGQPSYILDFDYFEQPSLAVWMFETVSICSYVHTCWKCFKGINMLQIGLKI